MFVDTHAHVHDKAFSDDRDAVVERMRAAGVMQAVTVGCNLQDSARALEVAERYGLLASAGIHPHEAKVAPAGIEAAFGELLKSPRVKAIGETGLDYYYDHSPRDVQQVVLRAQIAIACKHDLPVIFHHRDAYDDFAAILRQTWQPQMRGVVHCFTGDTAQAQTYTGEFGLYLGIGGVLTFKNAQTVRDAVSGVGLSRIVLETDCPYLAPFPHRGERNEPSNVAAIARHVADLLNVPLDEVAAVTTANARTLFGF